MKRNNFILGIALMIGIVLGGLCPAYAVSVNYIDASGKTQTASNATALTTSSTTLQAGWYVVNNNLSIDSRISISGTVHLILADGFTLTAQGGITVTGSNSLNIYGQTNDTGTLTIGNKVAKYYAGIGGNGQYQAGGTITINGGTVNVTGGYNNCYDSAGIGGGYCGAGGTITINGGTVNATGGYRSAGIGGGNSGAGGTVTINGGTVNATGHYVGAGIGGGRDGNGGTVTINGGTVNATGASYAAGIGGGYKGNGGTVTINGGTVIATGGEDAAGIGKGDGGSSAGTLTLGSGIALQTSSNNSSWTTTKDTGTRTQYMKAGTGANYLDASGTQQTAIVTALTTSSTTLTNGNWYIVSGDTTISDRITISGTVNLILADGFTLTAPKGITTTEAILNIYGQTNGTGALTINGVDSKNAGIGGVSDGAGGTVNIYRGNITVTGGQDGAGIGGGAAGSGGTVTINGGSVTSTGGQNAAGIGGGKNGNGGEVTISGGTVTATGGSSASGIGGGAAGSGGTVTINGGTVTSTGGDSASGIGSGYQGTGGTIALHGRIIAGADKSGAKEVKTYGGEKYVNVDATHEHSFTYTASGDTIIAKCNADGCYLDNSTTTLTICAPEAGGGAAVLSGDTYYFDNVSSSDITYAQKSDGDWGEATSEVPSGQGFFRASITAGGQTVTVTYGVSAITVSPASNGTVTAPAVATVSASVTLTVSPDTGYKLDTITASTDGGESITVTDNAFTMPEDNVKIAATFSQIDYTISFDVTSGSVTVPDTAHYGDTVRLVISPDYGYGIVAITVPSVTLKFISRDLSTGVEVYELTMPADNITVNVNFEELTAYTIFYKAASGVTSVLYRFDTDDTEGFEMQEGARLNDIVCMAGHTSGAKGRSSFPISFNIDGGGWGAFTDCSVVANLSSINSMKDGEAVLVEGDDNAFIAAFVWGDFIVSEDLGGGTYDESERKYYFVSKTTTNIDVDNPSKTGYDFIGWSYTDSSDVSQFIDADIDTTTVSIDGNIDKTTLFSASWQRSNPVISYDLDGGSWSGNDSETVSYGGTATQPESPSRSGYAFNGWVVKSNVTEQIDGEEKLLAAGSNFDFAGTKIIENITLKAAWKHVHAYTYIQLSKLNELIPNYVTQDDIDTYEPYVHFKLCAEVDDYGFEAHTYGKDGKCVCGAQKPEENVTLEITLKDRDSASPSVAKVKKNTATAIIAPNIGTDKFIKWEYRALTGDTWKDLAAYPVVAFAIPASMRVNGVYESMTAPKLTLQVDKYGAGGLLFQLQYVLPTGWTAKNAVIVCGNNHMLRYMYVNRAEYPIAEVSVFGISVGDFGTMKGEVVYKDREDNAIEAVGEATLRYKMLTGQAVNISGYNDAYAAKAQRLGQTSGLAYAVFTGVSSKADRYYYVLGWLDYVDASGNAKTAIIGPAAVTYNGIATNGTFTTTN